ncbi:hypothetical protein AB0465_14570 [Streptomyces griseoviridis]
MSSCRYELNAGAAAVAHLLALLEDQDTDLAARLRAVLQGDQP